MSNTKSETRDRLSGVTAIILLLLIIFIGFSVAKYNMVEKYSDTINTARWNVTLSDSQITRNSYSAEKVVVDKMAPGTQGTFAVTVNATDTETDVKYDVTIDNLQHKPANVYFEVDGNTYATLDEVASYLTTNGLIKANDSNKVITKTVTWKWDYETTTSKDGSRTTLAANDAQDTEDGKTLYNTPMSFDITIHAYQTNPGA